MKKTTSLILFFLFLIIHLKIFGADYNGYNLEFFFGRQPSARSEAMGQALVASYDGGFTLFYNPAGIILNQKLTASFSYASPYYLLTNANYNFLGFTYNIGNWGTIGISRFHFSFGENIYAASVDDPFIFSRSITPTTTFITVSYAKEIFTNLAIGLNFNFYSENLLDTKSYPVDIGLLKIIPIKREQENKQRLYFGVSIKNAFGSKINYSSQILMPGSSFKFSFEESLPIILRIGTSYELFLLKHHYLPNLYMFGVMFQIEYEDVLNDKYRTGIKFGSELSFFEIFYFRSGYYSFKVGPGSVNGKKRLTDFTYGFGIRLPVDDFLKKRFPLAISFDLTSLKQPSYVREYNDWDNFSIYSLNLNWEL